MKSLKVVAEEMLYLSSLLVEQAQTLQEIAAFFGVSEVGAVAGKKTRVKASSELTAPALRTTTGKHPAILPEVKEAARQDWNALPPHLRTKENRLALARKHGITSLQMFGLTKSREYFQKLTKNRNEKAFHAGTRQSS